MTFLSAIIVMLNPSELFFRILLLSLSFIIVISRWISVYFLHGVPPAVQEFTNTQSADQTARSGAHTRLQITLTLKALTYFGINHGNQEVLFNLKSLYK